MVIYKRRPLEITSAEEIELAERDTVMAQDVVGRGAVEQHIRIDKPEQISCRSSDLI